MRFSASHIATKLILLTGLMVSGKALANDTADYELIFESTWSAATHPISFPPGPHFSGLIGGTHNDTISLWEAGGIASDGIELMAEIGSKTLLQNEVNAAIGNGQAGAVISGPGIALSPGSASVQFTVSKDFPLVSVVSMIAPSPDWFVGVSGVSLRSGNQWIREIVIPLQPYDAGTDSGSTYLSPNADVTPHEPIFEIMGPPLTSSPPAPPLGTFTIRRLGTAVPAAQSWSLILIALTLMTTGTLLTLSNRQTVDKVNAAD